MLEPDLGLCSHEHNTVIYWANGNLAIRYGGALLNISFLSSENVSLLEKDKSIQHIVIYCHKM